mgnify:FL=1
MEARRRESEAQRTGAAGAQRHILPVDDAAVRRWGEVSGTVQRLTGRAPPVIDTLLAATAIERRLWLVARTLRDVRDTGSALFDPWNDDPAAFVIAR